MKSVIITDGFWRKSLSCVRSLGKEGYKITVFGDTIWTTSFWSKYTSERVICPSAKDKIFIFNQFITKFLADNYKKNKKKIILIPSEDATINWLSKNRKKISKYANFLLPNNSSLEIAQSKEKTLKIAKKIGINVPESFFFKKRDVFEKKIKKLSALNILENYIVKPVKSSGSLGIIFPKNNFKIDWKSHWKKYGKLFIQKKIVSRTKGIGISMIFDSNSNCIADFCHQRIKEYPLKGGPSTIRKSVKNYHLKIESQRLLKKLNWKGVAMVEWKYDDYDKSIKLLEINPRFWGSLELAVRAGVNFPLIYAKLSSNKKIKKISNYKIGIKCRWIFPGEILRYFTEKEKNKESFFKFLKMIFYEGEEYDRKDFNGFISSIICNFFNLFKPKYWKYLNR
jgi:predicted ATP-grasp superfamily ATP-dependent carboligase